MTEITQKITTKSLFGQANIQARFEKMLGKKAQGFISSVLQIINSNKLLSEADPNTVLNAAATAAALDLPINQNLGFAWIVPYKGQAQFQMGWKGYVQLALRTGMYEKINVIEVYENQFKSFNKLTEELDADFNLDGTNDVVGYAAYIQLKTGFKKTVYWSKDEVFKHAKKYSQSFKNGRPTPWNDDFDAMAKKTVLKSIISKWGIMSIEIQTAILSDQAVVENEDTYEYVDNKSGVVSLDEINAKEEEERLRNHLTNVKTLDELEMLVDSIEDKTETMAQLLENKKTELLKDLKKDK